MKKLFTNILCGKDTTLNGIIALGLVALIALGCTCGKNFDLANLAKNDNTSRSSSNGGPFSDGDDDDSEMPDDRLLKALVKETTADFAYAISTEDFSKLYEKASSDFQSTYTEEEAKAVFKPMIDKKKFVLPILAKTVSLDPEFLPSPSIRTELGNSILVANGKYDTKPVPMRFEYEYVKRGGSWKMLKLVVKMTN